MRIFKNDSGQVLVMTALSMTLLLGFVGMATDVGALFHEKRVQQTVTDAAAIAGATAYKYDTQGSTPSSNLTNDINNAAKKAAAQNGMTVSVTSSYTAKPASAQLYIASPPTDGPNSGSSGFVEAILTVPRNTIFMSLFGMHTVDVTTRAVAGIGFGSTTCMWITNPTDEKTMYMAGKFSVNAPDCSIQIDSTDKCALYFNGTSGSLTAGSIAVSGGDCKQTGDATPAPRTGLGQLGGDPYSGTVSWPTPSDCGAADTSASISGAAGTTYQPPAKAADKIYCFAAVDSHNNPVPTSISGPAISNSGTACPSSFKLPSGIYIFENGVIFNGGCIASGSGGITLDLYGNYSQGHGTYSMSVNTETDFNLNSMSTSVDPYSNAKFIIIQPPENTATLNFDQGTSVGTINGNIYAPSGQLSLTDHGAIALTNLALTITGDIVVNTFSDTASNISVEASADPSQSRLTRVTLVE